MEVDENSLTKQDECYFISKPRVL